MIPILPLIIFICFCSNTVLAISFILRFVKEDKPNTKINVYTFIMFLSSIVWSFGMGMMSIQIDTNKAFFWRSIGIAGTFAFMISVQMAMCYISTIDQKLKNLAIFISFLGIIIYFMYIQPGQTIFVQSQIGMTFYFCQNLTNILYGIYFVVVSTNIFLITLNIAKHNPRNQLRAAGQSFILVELCIFVGAITDLFMPVFGVLAFPGSAITHFWGVLVYWYAIHKMYKSEITVSNMSEYVYYSLDRPVVIFDSNYSIKIMNDAAKKILLLDENNDCVTDYKIASFFDLTNDSFNFESLSTTIQACNKKNNSHCEIAISKILDSYKDVIGYITLISDLTEHELIIEKLEQAKLAADSANMSKSLFLANMSHEIRTPLNAILGFSELALIKKNLSSNFIYFEKIKSAGESLLAIVNQILDISKVELGTQELNCIEYNTHKLFEDIKLIIEVQAHKKGLKFDLKINDTFPDNLYGDQDKIREILINLLNNSVKYTKTGFVSLDANLISKTEDKALIEFIISDSGIGIKEEDIQFIFDKFHRVDSNLNSSTEGTGLGLSIVKGLVDLMNGTINVSSIYGVGTQFKVLITQGLADAEHITDIEDLPVISAQINDANHSLSGKILVVDDNDINLTLVTSLLEMFEISYDACSSGYEAIEKCKSEHYRGILMDQMMPELDGIETMKEIRRLPEYDDHIKCPIYVLTADVIKGAKERLIAEGFDGYLAKPIDISEFEKVIRSF